MVLMTHKWVGVALYTANDSYVVSVTAHLQSQINCFSLKHFFLRARHMVANTCGPSTGEAEAGGLGVQA